MNQVNADIVLFDFNNGGVANAVEGAGVFDQGVLGDTATVDGLVLTVTDLVAPTFDDEFTAITGSVSAAAGDPGLQLNINGSNSLGVASPELPNGVFGNETDVFNTGEAFSFTFDQDVVFTAIELEGVASGDLFEVLVDGTSVVSGAATEGFQTLSGLDGLTIASGSEVTFAADGPLASTNFAVETFTVEIVAVPEPTSLALLGLGGMLICARRKRG